MTLFLTLSRLVRALHWRPVLLHKVGHFSLPLFFERIRTNANHQQVCSVLNACILPKKKAVGFEGGIEAVRLSCVENMRGQTKSP